MHNKVVLTAASSDTGGRSRGDAMTENSAAARGVNSNKMRRGGLIKGWAHSRGGQQEGVGQAGRAGTGTAVGVQGAAMVLPAIQEEMDPRPAQAGNRVVLPSLLGPHQRRLITPHAPDTRTLQVAGRDLQLPPPRAADQLPLPHTTQPRSPMSPWLEDRMGASLRAVRADQALRTILACHSTGVPVQIIKKKRRKNREARPIFHCKRCLVHWGNFGSIPRSCEAPSVPVTGPVIELTRGAVHFLKNVWARHQQRKEGERVPSQDSNTIQRLRHLLQQTYQPDGAASPDTHFPKGHGSAAGHTTGHSTADTGDGPHRRSNSSDQSSGSDNSVAGKASSKARREKKRKKGKKKHVRKERKQGTAEDVCSDSSDQSSGSDKSVTGKASNKARREKKRQGKKKHGGKERKQGATEDVSTSGSSDDSDSDLESVFTLSLPRVRIKEGSKLKHDSARMREPGEGEETEDEEDEEGEHGGQHHKSSARSKVKKRGSKHKTKHRRKSHGKLKTPRRKKGRSASGHTERNISGEESEDDSHSESESDSSTHAEGREFKAAHKSKRGRQHKKTKVRHTLHVSSRHIVIPTDSSQHSQLHEGFHGSKRRHKKSKRRQKSKKSSRQHGRRSGSRQYLGATSTDSSGSSHSSSQSDSTVSTLSSSSHATTARLHYSHGSKAHGGHSQKGGSRPAKQGLPYQTGVDAGHYEQYESTRRPHLVYTDNALLDLSSDDDDDDFILPGKPHNPTGSGSGSYSQLLAAIVQPSSEDVGASPPQHGHTGRMAAQHQQSPARGGVPQDSGLSASVGGDKGAMSPAGLAPTAHTPQLSGPSLANTASQHARNRNTQRPVIRNPLAKNRVGRPDTLPGHLKENVLKTPAGQGGPGREGSARSGASSSSVVQMSPADPATGHRDHRRPSLGAPPLQPAPSHTSRGAGRGGGGGRGPLRRMSRQQGKQEPGAGVKVPRTVSHAYNSRELDSTAPLPHHPPPDSKTSEGSSNSPSSLLRKDSSSNQTSTNEAHPERRRIRLKQADRPAQSRNPMAASERALPGPPGGREVSHHGPCRSGLLQPLGGTLPEPSPTVGRPVLPPTHAGKPTATVRPHHALSRTPPLHSTSSAHQGRGSAAEGSGGGRGSSASSSASSPSSPSSSSSESAASSVSQAHLRGSCVLVPQDGGISILSFTPAFSYSMVPVLPACPAAAPNTASPAAHKGGCPEAIQRVRTQQQRSGGRRRSSLVSRLADRMQRKVATGKPIAQYVKKLTKVREEVSRRSVQQAVERAEGPGSAAAAHALEQQPPPPGEPVYVGPTRSVLYMPHTSMSVHDAQSVILHVQEYTPVAAHATS